MSEVFPEPVGDSLVAVLEGEATVEVIRGPGETAEEK